MISILVIDDDDTIRILLKELLEDRGYKIFEASNGRLGIEICEQCSIDLVITDIVMPDLAGLATIVSIRRNHPNTKIIAISGGGGSMEIDDYLQSAKHFGALRTFSKPFKTDRIIIAIEEMLCPPAEN